MSPKRTIISRLTQLLVVCGSAHRRTIYARALRIALSPSVPLSRSPFTNPAVLARRRRAGAGRTAGALRGRWLAGTACAALLFTSCSLIGTDYLVEISQLGGDPYTTSYQAHITLANGTSRSYDLPGYHFLKVPLVAQHFELEASIESAWLLVTIKRNNRTVRVVQDQQIHLKECCPYD